MPEDIAIILSKSDVDPCSHGQNTDPQKSADGQTAFQLYTVPRYHNINQVGNNNTTSTEVVYTDVKKYFLHNICYDILR